jgi:hypothetical protein
LGKEGIVKEVFAITQKSCCKSECIPVWVVVLLAFIFGIAAAVLWLFGLITSVRIMLPYAFAAVLAMLGVTGLIEALCCCKRSAEDYCMSGSCSVVKTFSQIVAVAAVIFIAFALAVFASSISFVLNAILAFIGAISFFLVLFAFGVLLYCLCENK